MSKPIRHILGCMTGTSLDGLDVALTRITGSGLAMSATLVGMESVDLPEPLRETLMQLASGEAHRPIDVLRAARHLGVVHAQACAKVIARHGRGLENRFRRRSRADHLARARRSGELAVV